MKQFTSITVIYSPFHTGIPNHRVGDGPNRIKARGVVDSLSKLGVKVHEEQIERFEGIEGEIGRSFEVLARTSKAVSKAVEADSFPLLLSGNCMGTVGVACGLGPDKVKYIYFDAHDDMHTPSTLVHGYFDALGLPILLGESFEAVAKTIPGFKVLDSYEGRFLYVGLRDVTDFERKRVNEHGMDAIWGSTTSKVDYIKELSSKLDQKSFSPALVHLDLDVLDESLGKVNNYESAGGLTEDELVKSMDLLPQKTDVTSLVVCSFDPNLGDGDKIADVAVRAISSLASSMIERGQLSKA